MTTPLILHCEQCGATLRLAAGKMRPGATATCPKCRHTIRIPSASAAPQTEEIQCQVCGALLRLRADRRPAGGGTARCPRCQSAVQIPPLRHTAARPDLAAAAPRPPAPPAEFERPVRAPSMSAPPAPPASGFAPPGLEDRGPAEATDGLPTGITPALRPPAPMRSDTSREPAAPVAVAEEAGSGPPAVAPPKRAPGPRLVVPVEENPESREETSAPAGSTDEEPVIEIQGDSEEAAPPPAPAASAPGRRPAPPAAPPAARPGGPTALPTFWTVEISGETLRPGGVASLRHWARQGKLRAADRVRRGDGPWQEAREVPELASIFARQQAAPAAKVKLRNPGAAREGRHGVMAGFVGGAVGLVPVFALLIFSGEFERVSEEWGLGGGVSATLLCAGVLFTGVLIGRALAALQAYYEGHGDVANVWSMGGASAVGVAAGLPCGLVALGFWPHASSLGLVAGFAAYGAGVGFLVLFSYRSLFLERRT